MNLQSLKKAIELGQSNQQVLIGTANRKMEPHIAAGAKMEMIDDIHVRVSEWFCQTTVSNLLENPSVCLVVMDAQKRVGYQLVGVSEQIENMAVLGCWTPELEAKALMPQIERRVLVMVYSVLDFKSGPHSDSESI